MDEKLKQLESLLSMFDARDQMWAKHNRQIGSVITPTVLEALYELLELDHDSVEWVDLQIMENVLLVICNVTYDPATTKSNFLQRVDDAQQPTTPIQVQRFLRIGVPLAIVFADKASIKDFLMRIPVENSEGEEVEFDSVPEDGGVEYSDSSTVKSEPSSPPRGSSKMLGFDISELTEDHIEKLMLFYHIAEPTKQ